MTAIVEVRALLFDVFGTVVDWRGSIAKEGARLGAEWGLDLDWTAFADRWRSLYQPAMERIRSGAEPWANLDSLHRRNLAETLAHFGVEGLTPERFEHLNKAWHRLDPWPDSAEGLARLKRGYIVAAQSNGNVSLMVDLARHGGLVWDTVLGAEVVGHYKPCPESYQRACALLDLPPNACMMVAAHNSDLAAAAACGLRTAFIPRPHEHGPGQTTDLAPDGDWDVVAADLLDLAAKLGC